MQVKTLLLGTFFTSGAAMFSLHQHVAPPVRAASLTPATVHIAARTPPPPIVHKHRPAKPATHVAHAAPVKKAAVAATEKAPAPTAKPRHKPYFFRSGNTANS